MQSAEAWLPVVGFESTYEVSSLGRVRRGETIFAAKANKDGYPRVSLRSGERRINYRVHRLVLTAFVGPRPEGMVCCHADGDKTNNALTNLRWGSVGDNILDEVRHGTHANATKTHCPAGHPYTPENTYLHPSGRRSCHSCRRIQKGQAGPIEFDRAPSERLDIREIR